MLLVLFTSVNTTGLVKLFKGLFILNFNLSFSSIKDKYESFLSLILAVKTASLKKYIYLNNKYPCLNV